MKIKINKYDPKQKIGLLILPYYSGEELAKEIHASDKKLQEIIDDVIASKEFEGKAKQTLVLHAQVGSASKVMLLGLGEKKDFTNRLWFLSVSTASKLAQSLHAEHVGLMMPERYFDLPMEQLIESAVTATIYGAYRFEIYKSKKEDKKQILSVDIFLDQKTKAKKEDNEALTRGEIVGEAVSLTRDLVNHPANFATPSMLADKAKEIAKQANLSLRVLDRRQIQDNGMEALVSVSKGSHEPPRFIVLSHNQDRKALPTVVLVGKGITFDSGGISLKPSKNMHEMKTDMAGAAAVLGAMQAIGKLDLPLRVIGLVPTTENLPGGMAVKPGDVVTALNGKTIEILNTDAEGRLILADALSYAQQFKPDRIIDLATLTGACIVALGEEAAAVLGNDETLVSDVDRAASETGERVWQLPLWDVYKENMKSDVADVANIGKKPVAGTIMGAVFLENFAGDAPWAHLDIAGVAYSGSPKPYAVAGASGFGVRLLVELLSNLKGKSAKEKGDVQKKAKEKTAAVVAKKDKFVSRKTRTAKPKKKVEVSKHSESQPKAKRKAIVGKKVLSRKAVGNDRNQSLMFS